MVAEHLGSAEQGFAKAARKVGDVSPVGLVQCPTRSTAWKSSAFTKEAPVDAKKTHDGVPNEDYVPWRRPRTVKVQTTVGDLEKVQESAGSAQAKTSSEV
mmetsp:Transcript_76310/g.247520  ORF Transcript_76310/g.247520 Transcript_76310/m.247520 type:complete len:100 (+) Transcript_76310:1316-1615(+)